MLAPFVREINSEIKEPIGFPRVEAASTLGIGKIDVLVWPDFFNGAVIAQLK